MICLLGKATPLVPMGRFVRFVWGFGGWVLALAAVGIVAAGGYTLYSGVGDDSAVTGDEDQTAPESAPEDKAGSAQNDGGSSGGDQTSPEPAPEAAEPDPTPQGFTAITTGGNHSCGLRTDGTAQCWGSNIYGQGDAPLGVTTRDVVPIGMGWG